MQTGNQADGTKSTEQAGHYQACKQEPPGHFAEAQPYSPGAGTKNAITELKPTGAPAPSRTIQVYYPTSTSLSPSDLANNFNPINYNQPCVCGTWGQDRRDIGKECTQ